MGATAFYFLGTVFKKNELFVAGKWALSLGALSSVITAWTGFVASMNVPHGGGAHDFMNTHRNLGYTVAVIAVLLSIWVFSSGSAIPAKGRGLFLAALVLLNAVLIQGADLGGRMVFLHGVGVGRKSMMPAAMSEEHEGSEHGGHEHAGHEAAGTPHEGP
ncbi:MAG: DUF2231 domain-containing protein [Candidatus Omnitrophota bacterium]|nr:DUF2231 domain-containing protein [Candidatus Omnitrophota bacterium]